MSQLLINCCRTLTFNCYACKIPFKTKRECMLHLKKNHAAFKFECICCSRICKSADALGQHLRDKHENYNPYHCLSCHFISNDPAAVYEHCLDAHVFLSLGYYCTICGFGAVAETDMRHHLNFKHKTGLSFCFCSVDSTTAMTGPRQKYKFNCSYCNDYKSQNYESLSQHFRNKHWFIYSEKDSEESDGDSDGRWGCFLCNNELSDFDRNEMQLHLTHHDTSINCLFCEENFK